MTILAILAAVVVAFSVGVAFARLGATWRHLQRGEWHRVPPPAWAAKRGGVDYW